MIFFKKKNKIYKKDLHSFMKHIIYRYYIFDIIKYYVIDNLSAF